MADLTDDAVTFLFTDIEGSTARWEELPDAMQLAVARHDQLVRAAIEGHDGRVFKSTGDGFYAAFEAPQAAVRAALAIQRAVQATCWDEIGQLRLRVALHLGPAQQRDGDYFGQTLNRAARLVSATEGGEILLSDGIAEAARSDLPTGATLVSLGDLRLRDLREPIRVYRLTGPADNGALPDGLVAESDLGTTPEAARGAIDGLAQDGRLRIFVLGGFRVEGVTGALANDGWSRRKARQLFKCLLTRPSRRLTRDEAYELFWPDSDVAPSNFRVVLHALRQALVGLGVARPDELVLSDHDGVALNASGYWVDADAFERLVAPLHDAAASDDDLEAAARLYAGEFLADDLYETWTASRRDHLRRLWGDLLLELSHRREQRGEIDAAAAALQRRLSADPCDELATRELMRLWARHGRRADALRAYQRLAEALRLELGVDPGAEATRLRDGIVSGEIGQPAAVLPPVSATSAAPDGNLAAPVAPRDIPGPAPAPPFEPSYRFPTPARLVGRQDEFETLIQIVERGRSGGQVALIGGPAGAGKSALAGAVVREARARGFLCLVGGSFEQDIPIAFGSIRDALGDYLLAQEPALLRSELGGMVADLEPIIPELRYHLGLPGGDAGRQSESPQLLSVVHSCLRALASRQPVLLCLEDLHAADNATIAALPYFGRQIRRLPVMVLATHRTDETAGDHRLARLLPKLIRERMVDDVSLRPLAPDETALQAADLLGDPVDEALSCWLHRMTEGNPLFSELLMLTLREEGKIVQHPEGWRGGSLADGGPHSPGPHSPGPVCPTLPPAVSAVLERWLAPLDACTREALDVAAVLGQTFDLASMAAGLEADRGVTVTRLESLFDAHLIQESGAGYRFARPLLREALLQRMSVHRRASLEARAAPSRAHVVTHSPNGTAASNGWGPPLPLPAGG